MITVYKKKPASKAPELEGNIYCDYPLISLKSAVSSKSTIAVICVDN